MAKMEMPADEADAKETETKVEDALPGDGFSEQIAKLLPKEKDLIEKLVAALVK